MRKVRTIRARVRERGVALLISIFILLLISIVAIALIVASGTESALAGNYRSSTGVYYAALAGLEEARGRLLAKNPNALKTAVPAYFPAPGGTIPIGSILYVLNPSPTDNLATMLANYPDTEYDNEFGAGALAAANGAGTVTQTTSVWSVAPLNGLGIPGPLYKWVRVNAVSEQSINLDVNPLDAVKDANPPIYYDGTQLNTSSSGAQVLEITSLAQLPNGSQKIVQYLVAPAALSLPNFPAALTLAGNAANTIGANSLNFGGPNSSGFYINGTDSFHNPFGTCTPTATYAAIGYTNTHDNSHTNIDCCQVKNTYPGNYIGTGGTLPNVLAVTMPPGLQTPTDYNNLAQAVTQVADVILTPSASTTPPNTAYGSDVSAATSGMSNTNPMTVVVNGNLDLTGWHNQGYGLLLVTGNLIYDPDASWYGIVLVIGAGTINSYNNGSGEIDGAILVAQTVTPGTSGPLLGSLGPAYVEFHPGNGGQGFYYSSCWIKNAIPSGSYKILSFHEISQ